MVSRPVRPVLPLVPREVREWISAADDTESIPFLNRIEFSESHWLLFLYVFALRISPP